MESNKLVLSSEKIKAEALRLGFSACGISEAGRIDKSHEELFSKWLKEGKHASMNYMSNYTDKRLDTSVLIEGARSVISLALNYYPAAMLPSDVPQISWYAYGKDYHEVMKRKLNELLSNIKSWYPNSEIEGRCFCDTAPILERYWAWKGGIGWIGKNCQIIIPGKGSCFFLGEIILNTPSDIYNTPVDKRYTCGSCSKCIDACPTKALQKEGTIDARLCLSYLTIENRDDIPAFAAKKMHPYIYGCDRCIKACPHNRYSTPSNEEEFIINPEIMNMNKERWINMDEELYRKLFKGSAVKRAKFNGLKRNIYAMTGVDNTTDMNKKQETDNKKTKI